MGPGVPWFPDFWPKFVYMGDLMLAGVIPILPSFWPIDLVIAIFVCIAIYAACVWKD